MSQIPELTQKFYALRAQLLPYCGLAAANAHLDSLSRGNRCAFRKLYQGPLSRVELLMALSALDGLLWKETVDTKGEVTNWLKKEYAKLERVLRDLHKFCPPDSTNRYVYENKYLQLLIEEVLSERPHAYSPVMRRNPEYARAFKDMTYYQRETLRVMKNVKPVPEQAPLVSDEPSELVEGHSEGARLEGKALTEAERRLLSSCKLKEDTLALIRRDLDQHRQKQEKQAKVLQLLKEAQSYVSQESLDAEVQEHAQKILLDLCAAVRRSRK